MTNADLVINVGDAEFKELMQDPAIKLQALNLALRRMVRERDHIIEELEQNKSALTKMVAEAKTTTNGNQTKEPVDASTRT